MSASTARRPYTWQAGFAASLRARDRREKAYDDIIAACTPPAAASNYAR